MYHEKGKIFRQDNRINKKIKNQNVKRKIAVFASLTAFYLNHAYAGNARDRHCVGMALT